MLLNPIHLRHWYHQVIFAIGELLHGKKAMMMMMMIRAWLLGHLFLELVPL